MRLWPFKRKDPSPPADEPPPPWAGYTPTADMVDAMIAMEWPASEIVWVTRCIEMRRRIAELGQRVTELETALARARNTSAVPDKPRATRPSVVTRNQVRNQETRPKRSRAKYMRTYRANQAKLRVVTRDGDVA